MNEETGIATEPLRAAALAAIAQAADLAQLDQVRVRYLGKSGELTVLLKQLGTLPKEARPAAGALINQAKESVQGALEGRKSVLEQSALAARLA
ncbi:MAG: phenylalanine--tRNA ligase subunit alpha, partial [Chromatiaceae bacterium]|nr:phenylalanine--tRNA ligase subunit alpha [Chromatiaceae bacterium]